MKRALALACVTSLLFAVPARAQSPEDLANDISNKVMSPYCPGVTLHDCPSQNALELRDDIETYARDGMTEAEIMDRLEADFGPAIRAEPSSEGAGVLAWILPSIALLIGGGLAWMLVRRWFKRSRGIEDGDSRQVVTVSGDERERLDAELRQLRRES
ncbi:MAG: cytochrome c-type biogenesis protein [Actinomycetota bacterium]